MRQITFNLSDKEEAAIKEWMPMLERFKTIVPISLLTVLEKIMKEIHGNSQPSTE